MIRLDAATVLLQWATGGLVFTWVTTRHREVGLGYGWLMRGVYIVMAAGALACGAAFEVVGAGRRRPAWSRRRCSRSPCRGSGGRQACRVSGPSTTAARARVAAMTGIDRELAGRWTRMRLRHRAPREFPPGLDLVAPVDRRRRPGRGRAGRRRGDDVLAVARLLVGAAFLGSITDAMLLGHWYLVQPGLPAPACSTSWCAAVTIVWPFEVAVLLVRPGMVSVLNGTIDDGWGGVLGWFWAGLRGDDHRPAVRHPGGAAGAGVLRRDGRHRPALPGHPHRVRHRSRRPRRPRPVAELHQHRIEL